jgi:hypothetical protein
MKAFKHILLMTAVAGSLFFSSCADDKPTTNTTSTAGRINCKINGSSWSSDAENKYYYTDGDTLVGTIATLTNGELMIEGNRVVGADTSAVAISLVLTPAKTGKYEGTFDISAADGALYLPNRNLTTLLSILMGGYTNTYSVTLTKVDAANRKVSGLFTISMKAPAGLGQPDYMVTEGSFTDLNLK